jgi:hypothetical protein
VAERVAGLGQRDLQHRIVRQDAAAFEPGDELVEADRALPRRCRRHVVHLLQPDADALLGELLARERRAFFDQCADRRHVVISGVRLHVDRRTSQHVAPFGDQRLDVDRVEHFAHVGESLVGRGLDRLPRLLVVLGRRRRLPEIVQWPA